MKVWAQRRREDGAVLATPAAVVEGVGLLELVVVEIMEDGNRRPIRVARLMPIGERRILAQLKMPTLVQFRGWKLVLSGIEEARDQYGKVRGAAQTWLCELHRPAGAVGFRTKDTYDDGARVPRGAIAQSIGRREGWLWAASSRMRFSGKPPPPSFSTTRPRPPHTPG